MMYLNRTIGQRGQPTTETPYVELRVKTQAPKLWIQGYAVWEDALQVPVAKMLDANFVKALIPQLIENTFGSFGLIDEAYSSLLKPLDTLTEAVEAAVGSLDVES